MTERSIEMILGNMLIKVSGVLGEAGTELRELARVKSLSAARLHPKLKRGQGVIDFVIERVSLQQHVTVQEMHQTKRGAAVVEARWLCWRILREATGLSTPSLGRIFTHHYDHSTVISGLRKLGTRIKHDPNSYNWIEQLTQEADNLLVLGTPLESRK